MDLLDRHYTESIFSELLINCIDYQRPQSVIDLGIGSGSLTLAAYNKWKGAKYWGCDIDNARIIDTKVNLPFAQIAIIDGLDLKKKFPFRLGSIDIAVCNPPYFKVDHKERYDSLFKSVNLDVIGTIPYITADLIFLANNLSLLKYYGQLGIILPDGLITNEAFTKFRIALLSNYTVKSIVELPPNVFKKTEARTHILVIEKVIPKSIYTINISRADLSGNCSDSMEVSSDKIYGRMDYSFVNWKLKQGDTGRLTLKDLGCEVIRSSRTVKELRELGIPFLHTTDFKHGSFIKIPSNVTINDSRVCAIPGDIVIARVGRRCKVAMIESGEIRISDCLFIIRSSDNYRMQVFAALVSEIGNEWFENNAHGVCSQVISRSDLFSFKP